MNPKTIGILAGLAGIALALHCLWLWQPERQVLKHHESLLHAASHRSWSRFQKLIGEKFSDRWGHDKTFLERECRDVLRQFFALSITGEPIDCTIEGNIATLYAHLKIEGSGTPLAEYAKDEVNSLAEPFVFEWTRQSWKPWDWQLTRADNPQLRVPRGGNY